MTHAPHPTAELLAASRERLRRLTNQLLRLCRSTMPLEKFVPEYLSRLNAALGGQGVALWTPNGSAWLRNATHGLDDLEALDLHEGHAALLRYAGSCAAPVALDSGRMHAEFPEAHNPTECLLYLCPILVERKLFGLLEVFQRPNLRESTRTGQLEFLQRMADEAAVFVGRCRIGSLQDKLEWLERLAELQQEMHKAKDATGAWYALANAARRVTQADRVTVADWRGSTARPAAVSGQARFDVRGNTARRLEKLLTLAGRRGQPLWNTLSDPQMPAVLVPAWKAYRGETDVSSCVLLPIPLPENVPSGRGPWQAVLCLEWFEGGVWHPDLPGRVPHLIEAASWGADRVRRRAGWWTRRSPDDRTWLGWCGLWVGRLFKLGLLGGIAAALVFVQAELTLEARGTLEPVRKQDVFARADGEAVEVKVDHGTPVAAGAEVVRLRDEQLEFRLQQLVGRRRQIEQAIDSLQATRLHGVRLTADQQTKLAGDMAEQKQTHDNLVTEERLLRRQLQDLSVRTPLAGTVTTWNVAENLLKRPVRRGQVLLTVADPQGPWRLELQLPEEHWGLLAEAQAASKSPLTATFVTATDPRTSYVGTLERIAERAEVDEKHRNRIGLRVAFDRAALPPDLLRPGAGVTVQLRCGQKPLGQVWFHDVVDWFRREVWFRFF